MIYPVIPIFLVRVLGATFIDVGLIEGVAESTASILKIVSGYVSDRFGKRKPLAYSGYALAAIAKPLLAFATAWQQVLVIRFIDRLGKGVWDSARDAIVSESGGLGGKVMRLSTLIGHVGRSDWSAHSVNLVRNTELHWTFPPRVHT